MAGRDFLPVPAPPPAHVPELVQPGFSAAARRLDPLALKGEEAMGPEPERHREAWAAYEEIPEVGTLVSSSAGLLSQCSLYVGQVDEQGDETRLRDEEGAPVEPFDEQFVADCEAVLGRFVDAGGSQRGLLMSLSENWDVTGDAYMVGWPVDEKGEPFDGDEADAASERWEVVSRGALGKSNGRWTIQLGGDRAKKLPPTAIVIRMWRKHPRRPDDSRGWVVAALDACRDLRVFTLAQRAAGRSSIPAKILVAAQEASPKNLTAPGWPTGGPVMAPPGAGGAGWVMGPGGPAVAPGSEVAQPMDWATHLDRKIGDFVLEVLMDTQSGRSVSPAVVTVSKDYVSLWHQIDLGRAIDPSLTTLVDQARARLSQAADCPPEMLTGLGETNRWNGAQIAEDEYRRYFKPRADAIADAWTTECLWAGLRALEYPADEYMQVRVLVDSRGVVAEPDRAKNAVLIYPLGGISTATLRTACGFGEEDAPTPEERDEILAAFGRARTAAGLSGQTGEVNQQVGSALPEAPPEPRQAVEARRPPIGALTTRTAASTPDRELSGPELAEQLTAIEATARSRLEEAAEAALDRAIEKAGNKLRTLARRDHDLRGLLAREDARAVPGLLGAERARRIAGVEFATDQERREDLFAAVLLTLLVSFNRIAQGAYDKALRILRIAILGPGETAPGWAIDSIAAVEVARNIEAGGSILRESMLRLADREVFDPVRGTVDGEVTMFRVPAPVIRRTMAAAGGVPVEAGLTATAEAATGLVFGPALARFQPVRIGWTWHYGDEPRAQPYEKHLAISGRQFTGPDDPALVGIAPGGGPGYPGDHGGCKCDWAPVFPA